ncbi:MAG: acyl carrier protein [Rhodobacteraceae bacterium]|nr:acyl carrier protein [Paracoccaceae bacterium]
MEWEKFATLLAKFVKKRPIEPEDILFGGGIDISSILFIEFIMTLEEEFDLDIDVDDLDASIRTVGQLYDRVSSAQSGD